MKALRQVRDGWAELEVVETRLLRDLSIEDGVRQVLELQHQFEAQLQQTEAVFRQGRNQDLMKMQARLATLNRSNEASYVEEWLRQFEQALDDSTLISEYRRLRLQFTA